MHCLLQASYHRLFAPRLFATRLLHPDYCTNHRQPHRDHSPTPRTLPHVATTTCECLRSRLVLQVAAEKLAYYATTYVHLPAHFRRQHIRPSEGDTGHPDVVSTPSGASWTPRRVVLPQRRLRGSCYIGVLFLPAELYASLVYLCGNIPLAL